MSDGLIRRGLEPFLEPGERVEHAFRASSGPRRAVWLGPLPNGGSAVVMAPILLPLARALNVRNHIVAVTDRAILLIAASQFGERPKDLVARLPRRTQLGPFEGRGWITVNGTRLWVRDVPGLHAVQAADREIGHNTGPPESWKP